MKLHKEMTNLEIAELLRAVAAAYQLKDQSRYKFKIIAYERAADSVEHASSELKDLWDDGKLEEVPGIGTSISEHLDELFRTGKSEHFEEVMKGLPPSLFDLMKVPGIGAKTAYKISEKFKSKFKKGEPLEILEELVAKGEVAKMEGFGKQSQADIAKAIEETKGRTKRFLLPYASGIADNLIEWLREDSSVKEANPLGSLRREAATVGDIDIAVASDNPKKVLEHFTEYPKKTRVLEKGDRTASIILPGDVQVDLMVQPPRAYGALLQHLTGSKHHNIALREFALKQGLSLSEYGIRPLRKIKNLKLKIKNFKDEESFYNFLGLDWIPPELREDAGEIEAARGYKLPILVKLTDVKSDLQIHSNFDIETSHDLGESSMEEVVREGSRLRYEYLAFTEHNPSKSGHNEKQIVEILKRKREKIDKINYSLLKSTQKARPQMTGAMATVGRVFNSLEIDIKPEGDLPIPDAGFDTLDFALVSVHGSFRLDRNAMTKRVLLALAHPKVKIFAHPTARKLNEREGIELNWLEIFDFCKRNNKWLEINADPMRLDLPDTLVREAVKVGVKLTLGTDAHHINGLGNIVYGVSVARRGWATKDDIINTRSLSEFEKLIGR